MAVVEMRKLTVIGLNSSRTPFIHELMHLGVVEIDSNEGAINDEEWMPDIFRTSNSADVSRLEADISRVSTALEAIGKYDTAKKPLFPSRIKLDRGDFAKLMDSIKSVGAEGKFTYIFDLAYPIVIYQGAPSEDVTPLVKAKLGLK